MRLLFLTDNFIPEVNAPANRTYEHCKEWVRQGAEVTVITGVPNFPKGKVFDGYKNGIVQREVIDGIRVIRVWTYVAANEGFVKRILDYISFACTSFIAGLFVKTDTIIATSPQFFTAVSGGFLAFFRRKKWVLEIRDLWPESILSVGAMKRNVFIGFLEWVEYRLYKSANRIVVVTESLKGSIAQRGINRDKIFVHRNGVDLGKYKSQPKDKELVESSKLINKTVIGYIGTHGLAHGLSFILESIESLQDQFPDLKFLFIGDGAEKKNLQAKALQLKLSNVIFLDSVSKSQVVRYWSLLDFALVNLIKNDTFRGAIPSKIFEAAAMRKPILLGLHGEAQQLLDEYHAGLCFEPENQADFLEKVRTLITDKSHVEDLQKGCEKLAGDFDRYDIARSMLETIRKV